jgi:hypothetical protein
MSYFSASPLRQPHHVLDGRDLGPLGDVCAGLRGDDPAGLALVKDRTDAALVVTAPSRMAKAEDSERTQEAEAKKHEPRFIVSCPHKSGGGKQSSMHSLSIRW